MPRSDRGQVLELGPFPGASLGGLDQGEGLHLAIDFQGEDPGADDRGGDPDVAGRAVGQPDVDALEVRLKRATTDARGLLADAAQVLRLAAPRHVVAERGLLAADFALASHGTDS